MRGSTQGTDSKLLNCVCWSIVWSVDVNFHLCTEFLRYVFECFVCVCLLVNVSSKHFCLGASHATKFEDTVLCRLPSLLTPTARLQGLAPGVSKSILRFSNFLEGLKELTESYCIFSHSVLQGKETLKSARGRDTEGSNWEASTVFPKEPVCITLPAPICDNAQGVLPTRETYPDFSV